MSVHVECELVRAGDISRGRDLIDSRSSPDCGLRVGPACVKFAVWSTVEL